MRLDSHVKSSAQLSANTPPTIGYLAYFLLSNPGLEVRRAKTAH